MPRYANLDESNITASRAGSVYSKKQEYNHMTPPKHTRDSNQLSNRLGLDLMMNMPRQNKNVPTINGEPL